MPDNLSYRFASNVIKVLYEHEGFVLVDKNPGKAIMEEAGQDIEKCKLAALFAFIDEMIIILRYQNYFLTGCLIDNKNKDCAIHLRFCTGMLSTLYSIRILSGLGQDLSARTLLRYYYELSLLWSRIHLDNSAREQFDLKNFESSNEYWHRFISRRKTEKFLFDGCRDGIFVWIGATAEKHIDEIYEKLSLGGHPRFWGLHFNLSADIKSPRDTVLGRGPEDATLFTLSSALLLTTLPFGVGGVTNWNFQSLPLFDTTSIHPARTDGMDWTAYCHELRKMILGLFLFSSKFSTELGGGKW